MRSRVAGRRRGDAQEQRRVVGRVGRRRRGAPRRARSADAGGHRPAPGRPTLPNAPCSHDPHPVPRLVADPGDRAGRRADAGHQQRRRRRTPSRAGHGVLVLQGEHVTRTAGQAVQLDPGAEQHVVGLAQRLVVALGQHVVGGRRPSAARARRGGRPGPPSGWARAGRPPRRAAAWRSSTARAEPASHALGALRPTARPAPSASVAVSVGVAGEVAHRQQRRSPCRGRRRPGAAPPSPCARRGRASAWRPTPGTRAVSVDRREAPLAVVEEQDVEVAPRRQLGPPVAADRDQRHDAGPSAGRRRRRRARPATRRWRRDSSRAKRRAADRGVGEQRLARQDRHAAEGTVQLARPRRAGTRQRRAAGFRPASGPPGRRRRSGPRRWRTAARRPGRGRPPAATVMPAVMATAQVSMRLAAPSPPTIWAPSRRPVPRSATTASPSSARRRGSSRTSSSSRSAAATTSKPARSGLRLRRGRCGRSRCRRSW